MSLSKNTIFSERRLVLFFEILLKFIRTRGSEKPLKPTTLYPIKQNNNLDRPEL